MNDAPLRGARLGATSYESEAKAEAAERQMIRYRCEGGHELLVPFSVDAEEIPRTWGCRCGQSAQIVTAVANLTPLDDRAPRHVRTHWDMLLERRTIADLEELLEERLSLLRGGSDRKSA